METPLPFYIPSAADNPESLKAPGVRITLPPTMIDMSAHLSTLDYTDDSMMQSLCVAIATTRKIRRTSVPNLTAFAQSRPDTLLDAMNMAKNEGFIDRIMTLTLMQDLVKAISNGFVILFETKLTPTVFDDAILDDNISPYQQLTPWKEPNGKPWLAAHGVGIGYHLPRQMVVSLIYKHLYEVPMSYILTGTKTPQLWTLD